QQTRRGRGDLQVVVQIDIPRHLTKEQKELWEKLKETEKKKSWWGR
ncbi:molecular chaperone DnaJ, partial [Candidatus Berkelbacteria bacterium]|nr:molecular chaperone DnaJ [Candidatus Berkelbacteria bacterium]